MLDPEAAALLALIESRGMPPTHLLTPAEARAFYRERRRYTQPEPPPLAEVRNLQASGPGGDIGLRLYRAEASSAMTPALVYFHGGGWTIGDLDTHDVLCRQLGVQSGCAIVSVDYRLAPEHRFPAAVEDSLAAVDWVRSRAAGLGIDVERIAVGGDSAGGNLAAVAAIALRDAGGPPLAFQLLIYPATDMRAVAPSHSSNGQGYLLTADTVAYFRGHYIDPEQWTDWRASPLLHTDLSRLPAALVLTAGYDPLRDEALQYADALSAAGNSVQYVCFQRQIHGFVTMGRVLAEANTAVAVCAHALKTAITR